MTALLIVSGIIAYVFIALVVGNVVKTIGERKCDSTRHNYCDHDIDGVILGITWPVGPIFYLLILALGRAARSTSNKILKNGDDKK